MYLPYLSLLFCSLLSFPITAQFDQPPLFENCDDPLISLEQQIHCSREKLVDFVAQHVSYPQTALENELEGLVTVQFEVDSTGEVTMVQLLKGLERYCNEEALRVVRTLPRFKPARLNGAPVEATMILPIRFNLKNLLYHKNDDLYTFHWSIHTQEKISKKELVTLLDHFPFVRTAKGVNHPIEKLALSYIKGKKVQSATMEQADTWTITMQEILKKARRGGVLIFTATITDRFQTVEVVQEYYIK